MHPQHHHSYKEEITSRSLKNKPEGETQNTWDMPQVLSGKTPQSFLIGQKGNFVKLTEAVIWKVTIMWTLHFTLSRVEVFNKSVHQKRSKSRFTTEWYSIGQYSTLGMVRPGDDSLPYCTILLWTYSKHWYSTGPPLMTIGGGWKIAWLVRCPHFCRHCCIHLSTSYSMFPSLMNKTARYLNYSTWGSKSYLTRSRKATLFRMRTVAFELLCTLL